MIKCTFYLPTHDNDGREFPPGTIGTILDRLYNRFGGYTDHGTIGGTYKMDDGSQAVDRLRYIDVCCEPAGVEDLQAMVADFGRTLKQESMYFEVSLSNVEFVRSAEYDHREHLTVRSGLV